MKLKEYKGERPVVVVTTSGSKVAGFFSITAAIPTAQQGIRRHILVMKHSMWAIHSSYYKGKKVKTYEIHQEPVQP